MVLRDDNLVHLSDPKQLYDNTSGVSGLVDVDLLEY